MKIKFTFIIGLLFTLNFGFAQLDQSFIDGLATNFDLSETDVQTFFDDNPDAAADDAGFDLFAAAFPDNVEADDNTAFDNILGGTDSNPLQGLTDAVTTGIEEDDNVEEVGIIVYPNPAVNAISFAVSEANKFTTVEIYDVNGTLIIQSYTLNNVDVFGLNAGVYVYKLISDGVVSKGRFLKY